MRHNNSHLDVKQDDNSRDHSTLCQKQNSDNHTSKLDEVSPAIKQEPCDLQQRQSSEAPHNVPETHEEASTLSCKNETQKDSDKLVQKPSSDPGIPEQEPNTPLVSHLMGDCPKIPKDEPVDLHLRQSSESGVKTSVCAGERTSSVKREVVRGTSLPVQNFKWVPVLLSDKQNPTQPTQPEKTSEKLQPRRNPHLGGVSSRSDQITVPSSLSQKICTVPKEQPQANNSQPKQCLDAGNHALLSKEEEATNTEGESVSPSLVQMSSSSIGVPIPQPGQGNYIYSTKFEKVEKLQPRRNPDPVVQESQSGAENNLSKVLERQLGAESSQSKVTDRGSDDGYNWRKYGQKLVKGNNFSRSYYKCTYPNCQAKKQVERSHDGCKTEVNYIGNHHHEKPQQSSQVTSAQVRIPEMPIPPASKTNSEPIIDHGDANQHMGPPETSPQSTVAGSSGVTVAVSCSNDDNKDKDDHPDSKRQKIDVISPDDHVVNKSNYDVRHVVQTLSEVDVVNDGYRWRKYGQKLVKGNPNPRSYYRCSYAGCPVKKHVERASHDSKVVVTTYEGKHDHDMPASRSVNQSVARSDADPMTLNGESSSKPEENNPVSLERVVHVSAN